MASNGPENSLNGSSQLIVVRMAINGLPMKTLAPYFKAVWVSAPMACLGAFLMLLVSGIFEGFGILMLIPVLEFLGVSSGDPGNSPLLNQINEFVAALGLEANAISLLSLVFAILFVRAMTNYLQASIATLISAQFLHDTRAELYSALTSADWHFISRQSTSGMTHAVTVQSDNISQGAEYTVQLAAAIVSLAVGVTIAALMSVKLTGLILVVGAIIFIIMTYFNRRTQKIAGEENTKTRQLFKQIERHFTGLKTVKILSAEPELESRFMSESLRLSHIGREASLNQAQASFFFQTASAAFLIVLVYLAIEFFPSQNVETILLIIVFSRLAPKANLAQSYLRALLGVIVEFDRSQHLIRDAKTCSVVAQNARPRIELNDNLSFKNVSFTFTGSGTSKQVCNVDLNIRSGTTLGVVGRSGAGKSTLIDLMCGLLKPIEGEIQIDGTVLDDESRSSWLARTVYVPQDEYLFEGSIAENMRIATPASTDSELWNALEKAGIDGFVRSLPEALDTLVGSRGTTLSRGQRQRFCLARGLLKKPSFLVLDEAMNAVNPLDENEIMKTVRNIPDISTLIFVSHRLSSIAWVDNIIIVDDGRIVEQGSFQELSKSKNSFVREMLDADKTQRAEPKPT